MINYSFSTSDIRSQILSELRIHPVLKPVDAYKYLYQAVFGPFHILQDKEQIIQSISKELRQMKNSYLPLYQNLGNTYTRVSLSLIPPSLALEAQMPLIERFASVLIDSCQEIQTPEKIFSEIWRKALPTLKKLLKASALDWAKADYYVDKGEIPSHSPEFHAAYTPHYRLIKRNIIENTDIYGE